jgi:hypothetical protein
MIRFALNALGVVDEMNERLNAALSVRIGVDSGRPLLACVLGIAGWNVRACHE